MFFYHLYFASLSIAGYVLPLFTGEIMKQNVLIKGISDRQAHGAALQCHG
jgi:hypothetical protein